MTTRAKTLIGTVAWIAFAITAHTSPLAAPWTEVLLVFAALVLAPLAFDLVTERRDAGKIARSMRWISYGQLPAAALLAFACGLKPGLWALLAAIPWAAVTALSAAVGFGRMLRDAWSRPIDRLSADVGMIYLLIGGVWALADRGGLRPMRLDSEIVALTAVHFHFAGFLLPIFTGLALRQMPDSRFAARAAVGVALGVPAVALGITVTQLGASPAIEAAAGCALALSAMAVAILHVRWAWDNQTAATGSRILLGISGASLFFAMALSVAYASRAFVSFLPWLGLPQMRAIHGTLNAIGFALCGALGWRGMDLRPSPVRRR
jgi:hypothetical protein